MLRQPHILRPRAAHARAVWRETPSGPAPNHPSSSQNVRLLGSGAGERPAGKRLPEHGGVLIPSCKIECARIGNHDLSLSNSETPVERATGSTALDITASGTTQRNERADQTKSDRDSLKGASKSVGLTPKKAKGESTPANKDSGSNSNRSEASVDRTTCIQPHALA